MMLITSASLSALAHRTAAQEENRQLHRDRSQQTDLAPQRRIALVIGNGAYTTAPPLKNPPNDARDMATTLRTLGFNVTSDVNVNQRDMKRLIREFGQNLKKGGSGLFYYAGHGVQSKGHNYLIPIDADIQSEAEIEDLGVDVNLVLNFMDDAQNGLNIVILDACRNNPFARSFRSASNGLAQVDAPTGTLIAYATAPGSVAADGDGRNGIYTQELLKQIKRSGLSIEDVFKQVRISVRGATNGKQTPWESSSLVGEFYFNGKLDLATNKIQLADNNRANGSEIEEEYWANIRSSDDPKAFEGYLREYPSGKYVTLARQRISNYEARDDQGISVKEYLTRGILAFDKGRHSDAIAATTKAIALAPENAGAYFSRGSVYLFGTMEYPKAIADFKKAIEIDPKYFPAYNGLGLTYHKMKQHFTAVVNFSTAIMLNPKIAASYGLRAESYEKLGKKEHAVADRAKFNELKKGPR